MVQMELISQQLFDIASDLGELLKEKKLHLVIAESCTGGFVSQVITSVSGSSEWFNCGFVTYSNEAKQKLLSVSEELLKNHGTVSEEVAKAMAEGALNSGLGNISLSVTGIAGPKGGSKEKPVGTCWFAWSGKPISTMTDTRYFVGDREAVRSQAVYFVLEKLKRIVIENY